MAYEFPPDVTVEMWIQFTTHQKGQEKGNHHLTEKEQVLLLRYHDPVFPIKVVAKMRVAKRIPANPFVQAKLYQITEELQALHSKALPEDKMRAEYERQINKEVFDYHNPNGKKSPPREEPAP